MQAKKILLVLQSPPLPFGNSSARWYYCLIQELIKRQYRIKVLVACENLSQVKLIEHYLSPDKYDIKSFIYSTEVNLLKKIKSLIWPSHYVFSKDLITAFHSSVKNGVDYIHLEQLSSAYLLRGVNYSNVLINIHFLNRLDFKNFKPLGIKNKILRVFAIRSELSLIKYNRTFSCVSDRLTQTVLKLNSNAKCITLPFGIDCSKYSFNNFVNNSSEKTLILIGSMDWLPSHEAAVRLIEKIWPRINLLRPNVKLKIVGHNCRRFLQKYLNNLTLEFIENVPDIIPYFKQATLMIYPPTHGSGIKVKVVEAMLLGLPVVTNSCGIEGIPAIDRVHFSNAHTDEHFIEKTIELLDNDGLQLAYKTNARTLIETTLNPKRSMDLLEKIYLEL